MTAWSDDELRRVGDAAELELASRRPDGSLRPYTTMWMVSVGDDLYVRSDPSVHDAIDDAYHAKYDRYGPGPVGAVTGPAAHQVTIRLVRP
jgi:hypothetical protein